MTPPDVAIVVTSLNRPIPLFVICNGCFWHQTIGARLIVIDQSENYEPISTSTVYAHVPWMRGASNGRNLGMDIARQLPGVKYIGFWDDDDHPANDYVEVMRQVLIDNPDVDIVACQVMHGGYVLPTRHKNGCNRMIRADKIGDKRWPGGKGADWRWWNQFRSLKTGTVERVLYTTGNELAGGIRDATGCK